MIKINNHVFNNIKDINHIQIIKKHQKIEKIQCKIKTNIFKLNSNKTKIMRPNKIHQVKRIIQYK